VILADDPAYTKDGLVLDLQVERRPLLHRRTAEFIAELQALDWRALGLGDLDRPEYAKAGLDQQLGYWQHYYEWTHAGRPGETLDAAMVWLVPTIRAKLQAIDGSSSAGGIGDESTTRDLDQLRRMREIYPAERIEDGNAVGDADHCARSLVLRFDAGADSVLLHGSPPSELASLLAAWPRHRPAGRFDRLPSNPGRTAKTSQHEGKSACRTK